MGNGKAALAALVALCLSLAASTGATEAAGLTHEFDPALSLTGSCATSSLDPDPDPGCPEGDHPATPFERPSAVTTDAYGDIYVANFGGNPSEGRIDVFAASGAFITDLASEGPESIAVDRAGNLYVVEKGGERLVRYPPIEGGYKPESGEIAYGGPVLIATPGFTASLAIAVDTENGHLYLNLGQYLIEYGSAAEGNPVLDEAIQDELMTAPQGPGLAIDVSRGRIYATDSGPSIRVFELAAPHSLLATINSSAVPTGKFGTFLTLAVDEGTGHLFLYEPEGKPRVYELTADGTYVTTIEHSFSPLFGTAPGILAVDNGPHSPNGALNPSGRYLFVPSNPNHVYAFGPPSECEPIVESAVAAHVTETEATLEGSIDPCGGKTTYSIELVDQASFEAAGFNAAATLAEGDLPPQKTGIAVSGTEDGLLPGTAYRFRIIAHNSKGSTEKEGHFATYPADGSSICPNEAFRVGYSALLADCRAYELVTPPDTNARTPLGVGHLGIYFETRESSPTGDKVSFQIEGGVIPGSEGTGGLGGDPYLAQRGPEGWSTSLAGATGTESSRLLPGSTSPDQGFSFWEAEDSGSAVINGAPTDYLRYPDGHSELLGRGSQGVDFQASGKLISENGGHVVFVSENLGEHEAVALEEDSPPPGTEAIYDRTIDQATGQEATQVVSLLPGDAIPGGGEDATYYGASPDGKGIGFEIGPVLYLRYNDERTYKVGEEATFAGVAEGGQRIFYLKEGSLFAFDIEDGGRSIQFASGNVVPVNVSANGRVAYVVSTDVLTKGVNPNGKRAKAGEENLYRSEEGAISFVGTVTERDVEGETGNHRIDGLGLWVAAIGPSESPPGDLGADPSRTTPDGQVLLFESRAPLTEYDSDGHSEIYRYDFAAQALQCVSCIPTEAPAAGTASLESVSQAQGQPQPFSSYGFVNNLRADGQRAFFQSTEALVPTDTDELQDIYEWEARGVGSCDRREGCLFLISSGSSSQPDYLYAVSDSGDDVFFRSSDLLLTSDVDATPSIYDARVDGGFPSKDSVGGCGWEACRPALQPPSALPTPQTSPGSGRTRHHCRKGQRRIKRRGKIRCVRKHRHHRQRGSTGRKNGAHR